MRYHQRQGGTRIKLMKVTFADLSVSSKISAAPGSALARHACRLCASAAACSFVVEAPAGTQYYAFLVSLYVYFSPASVALKILRRISQAVQ